MVDANGVLCSASEVSSVIARRAIASAIGAHAATTAPIAGIR
jgi:hypothetical protein